MHRLTTHLRGLLVALATLALTAGVAFAARPVGDTGLERATDAAGKVVPVGPSADEPALPEPDEGDEDGEQDEDDPTVDEDLDEDEDTDEDVDEDDGEEDGEDADQVDGERAENHGWFVSEAAKGDTPDTYRNHGAYVSEIARGDDGKPGSDEETDDVDQEVDGDSDVDEDTDGDAAATVKATGKDKADHGKPGKAKAGKAERSKRGGK